MKQKLQQFIRNQVGGISAVFSQARRFWLHSTRRKIIVVSIAVFAGLLVWWVCSGGIRDVETIRHKDVLRIAVRFNQIDCMTRGDTLAGFQYELAKHFAEDDLHVKARFIKVADLSEAILLLQTGKVDLIAQNIPQTADMLRLLDISAPILVSRAVLVQRKTVSNDSLFVTKQLQLAKRQVCVVKGSPYVDRINNLSQEISDTIYVNEMKLHDAEELILLVAKGTIRYGVCDEKVAQYFTKRFPDIDDKVAIGFSQLQGWGVRKENPSLMKAVNLWLKSFVQSDEFRRIYGKYYN
jgi:membrane-bound lytic murein transglycosylase MltF